jgi:predicted regulator of Ras-like GTPase activity (Roadblock/LC7/MglB family)
MTKNIPLFNITIARRLQEVAQLLHSQGSNPFRVLAYQHAAQTLEQLERPIDDLVHAEGIEGLKKLPGIGESLARAIRELVRTGRLPMLERLRGETEPESLLATIPGIGKKLANRLHHDLEIDTLEELEVAAHDGRLRQAGGIGDKRLAGIMACLTERLGRVRAKTRQVAQEIPAIEELLNVDREYREQAKAGVLHLFAPRRFNPTHDAWLPVLHTQRGDRHYTALFSNTARAHQKGKTRDWVVLFFDDGEKESQCTIITAEWGILEGRRIVRGREAECLRYYEKQTAGEQKTATP